MQVAFMAAYTVVLLAGLSLSALNLRHLRRAGRSVPSELEGVVEPERLARIAAYTVDRGRFAMFHHAASALALGVFLFGGGLGAYDRWFSGFSRSFVWHGVVFFGGLALAGAVLELPFSFYQSFRIEARHGFNRTSVGLFAADWLKGTLLSLVFVGVMSSAALASFAAAEATWWLWFWLAFVAFNLIVTFAAPYLIEPLFFKMEPLDVTGLEQDVRGLADRAGVHIGRVLKVDASRRSAHSNAYFTGIGRVKRVVLFDTLLAQMTHPEILAVLAHELGHWKKHHVRVRMLVSFGVSLFGLYLISQVIWAPWVPTLVGLEQASLPARAVVLAGLLLVVGFPLTPIGAAWSRRDEWQADQFAVELSGRALDLASALAKLSRENLANLHPHPLYAKFYYTHPPVAERIRALRASVPA